MTKHKIIFIQEIQLIIDCPKVNMEQDSSINDRGHGKFVHMVTTKVQYSSVKTAKG